MELRSKIERVQKPGEFITTGHGLQKTVDLHFYAISDDDDCREDAFAAHALMIAIDKLPYYVAMAVKADAEFIMAGWGVKPKVTP